MDARITEAARTFLMCNAALLPLFAVVAVSRGDDDAGMSASPNAVTLGSRALDGTNASRLGLLAEGIVHVALGHPAEARTSDADPSTFGAASRIRAWSVIGDCPTMPSGMVAWPDDIDAMVRALRKAGINDQVSSVAERDALAAAIATSTDDGVAASFAAMDRVLAAGDGERPDVTTALGVALHLEEGRPTTTLATSLARVIGTPAIRVSEVPDQFAETASVLHAAAAVATVDQGIELMRWIDGKAIATVPRSLLTAAVMEDMLRSMKRHGVRSQDIQKAFSARAAASAQGVFGGPLIRLSDMRTEAWVRTGADDAWLVDGGSVIACLGDHNGRPEAVIAMPRQVAAMVGGVEVIADSRQTTLREYIDGLEKRGVSVHYIS